MRFSAVAISLATLFSLAACSSVERDRVDGDFDYVETKPIDALTPAEGLQLPEENSDYRIPNADQIEGVVGKNIVISAPVQVRPVAAGARVEESEANTKVYFDEVEEIEGLADIVWNGVTLRLERDDIGVREKTEQQSVETDWMVTEEEITIRDVPFWDFTSDEEGILETRQRFRLTQETAPHGRTTSVSAELLEIEQFIDGEPVAEMTQLIRRNAEATFLNSVIESVLLLQQREYQAQQSEGVIVDFMRDEETGEIVFLIPSNYDTAWSLTGLALEELGFEIDDLNKTAGVYYLEYSQGGGIGNTLAFWRDSADGQVDIPNGEYELSLMDEDDQIQVRIKAVSIAEEGVNTDNIAERLFDSFAEEYNQQSRR